MKYLAFIILSMFLLPVSCNKNKSNNEEIDQWHEVDIKSVADIKTTGWKVGITRHILNKTDLDKYAGRFASLYSAYGFRKLISKEYKNANSISIFVEVFELDKSDNAFGLYSFDTIGKKLEIGQGSVYNHGILRFWKDRIFVRISAPVNYREVEKDIINFAKAIEKKIEYEGKKPNIIEIIPEENLVPDSLCFFHHVLCLNNIYYVPEAQSLALSEETDAIAVQYNMGGAIYPRLVVIKYPDESSAQNAYNSFSKLYFDVNTPIYNDKNIEVVRTEDGEYNSISLKENYIVLVFESRSAKTSRQLADATLKEIDHRT